jgi:transposase
MCRAIFVKKNELDNLSTIHTLIKEVEALTNRVQQLEGIEKENKILREEIVFLKTENAELKMQLNSNSRNSSKPPSSDGYTKKPAFPKVKGGKQGGQKGHKGTTLKQIENPDNIVSCSPNHCKCGHKFSSGQLSLSEKRQVFELPIPKLEITEYQILKATCPSCGIECKGKAPLGVNSPVQYGNNVKALTVLLNVHYKLPLNKTQKLLGDLFGYPVNESTVYSATEKCYEKLEESETIIKSRIIENNVAHADESGVRVKGKLYWLHTATNLFYTYLFVHEKRGKLALTSDKSILQEFMGWLVHDCWGSYFNFKKMKHAICGAHILRELEGLVENQNTKWARVFKIFLMSVYLMPFEERAKHKTRIKSRYDIICGIGEKAEPPPIKTRNRGKMKQTKGRNLVERLIREKKAVLAFAFNKDVPFTNNLAERDIRPIKVKQKISNCFRTTKGAEIYARIEGFISTARKNKKDVFSELCTTFEGYNFITQ